MLLLHHRGLLSQSHRDHRTHGLSTSIVNVLRSGAGDSNSDFFLGRKVGYRYTSPAERRPEFASGSSRWKREVLLLDDSR